ncbi:adenosylcobinamide-GDP ribazoletransferase [Paenibacillus ginsengarvi]|uniref:Adenosylcobinamide-GDP ribazoletransferase n=1 Tax=Paenibacillus ginsengarvi TaxID=400777 RepID=A0A3B0BMS1_9BACL|nr:adenosylcobinamide-GDP ribazoletransferase [Paenibacillus ginsengarvi]RKN72947.1 adenosylcobinamide-GDP ribazoletransferase [Paenibacillus ginsengarvi]
MRDFRSRLVTGLQACAAAFQFLTRIPIPVRLDFSDDLCRRSTVYYPVVGGVIGVLVTAAGWLLAQVLPAAPASVLALGVWVALSGALHLDGLMDTADGLLSHRSRERMLEIMKDSRVGAMGVIAGVLLLLMKFSLLATLLPYSGGYLALLIVAPVWGRSFIVIAIAGWPYAREGQGLGSLFKAVTRSEAAWATVWAAAVTWIVMWMSGFGWLEAIAYSAGLTILTGAIGYVLARGMARKLGGLTGDTYGALVELLECAVLLAAVVAAGANG